MAKRASLPDEQIARIRSYPPGTPQVQIAVAEGLSQSTVSKYRDEQSPTAPTRPERTFKEDKDKGEASLELKTCRPVKTLADALKIAEVDLKVWEVQSWEARQWTTPMKLEGGQKTVTLKKNYVHGNKVTAKPEETLQWRKSRPIQQQQYLVAMKLRRKTPQVTSLEAVLKQITEAKFTLPVYKPAKIGKVRRALEISLMDPHLGLRCFRPQADMSWSLDEAEQAFMATTEKLLEQAESYGPFEEIVAPIGNDYLHADSIWHETTGGTPQPEMESMHEVYLRGEKLMLWLTERLRKLGCKVYLPSIPGNHDRFAAFTMARLVRAYYEGAKIKTVTVDASASPYKFWRYGVNLIGFEHGHSVKAIRLAALMANECRLKDWQEARYCEWHLGDQHRKGSSKPSTHEEQGVSVEYLPSLTPPNEWHRLKSYNWQKRGAFGFIYDHSAGPIARIQVNFDSYTGKHLGAA